MKLLKLFTGVDPAKLVVKAILGIEDSGGEVVGLTSDGASTNRTMCNSLGVIVLTQYLISIIILFCF